mgnify:CR=1 FL=1
MEQTLKRINTVELDSVTLGHGSRVLMAKASVGFGWGELTALIGRNGTGKSTLLRTIAALAIILHNLFIHIYYNHLPL